MQTGPVVGVVVKLVERAAFPPLSSAVVTPFWPTTSADKCETRPGDFRESFVPFDDAPMGGSYEKLELT